MARLTAWWDRSNGMIVVVVLVTTLAVWGLALLLDLVELSRQPFDVAFLAILVLAAVLTLSRLLPLWGWAPAASVATVAVALMVVDLPGDGARWLGVVLAIAGVLSFVARTCAKTTLRVLVLFSVLLVVLLLARVGADEVEQEARQEADELAARELPDQGLTCARDGRTCLRALRQQLYDDATAELQAARAAVAPEVLIEARRRLAATRPTALRLEDLRSLASRLDAAAEGADDATAQALGTATDAVRTLLAQRVRRTVSTEAVATARTAVDTAITTLTTAQVAAVTEAEAAQEAARKALDATDDPPVATDLADLVREGADAVVARSADLVVDDDDVAGHLGDIGWVVALILALFGYRRLERRNNLTYGAPVAVSDLQVSGDGLDAKYVKESLTVRYGATDLVEPAGVPGGPALATVATTLKDSEVSGGKLAGAFVTLAEKTLFPAAGITVYGTVDKLKAPTPPTPPPDEGLDIGEVLAALAAIFGGEEEDDNAPEPPPKLHPFRAALSLRTTNENRYLRTETFDADTLENLLDDAGAMVAADVMGYSKWTPAWASDWGPRGTVLRTYRRLVDSRRRFTPEEAADLTTATALAPANGLVRLLLAHSRDLDGEPLEALRLNLQNRLTYPRFLRGRYRLTTSLSMLAAPSAIGEHWWPTAEPANARELRRLIALDLEQAATAGGWLVGAGRAKIIEALQSPSRPSDDTANELRGALLEWAAAEADEQSRAFTLPFIVANARRQSERRFWLDLLKSRTRRRAERGRVESLRAIVDLRRASDPDALGDADHAIRKAADAPDASFNVLYNAACYWSLRSGGDSLRKRKAVAYLAVALRKQGTDTRVLAWARRDPDLEAIRSLPEFDALLPPTDD